MMRQERTTDHPSGRTRSRAETDADVLAAGGAVQKICRARAVHGQAARRRIWCCFATTKADYAARRIARIAARILAFGRLEKPTGCEALSIGWLFRRFRPVIETPASRKTSKTGTGHQAKPPILVVEKRGILWADLRRRNRRPFRRSNVRRPG